MDKASLLDNISYKTGDKPTITVLFETNNTKEIRIVMKKGQFMKEHKAPFPIIVELFDGEIEFGVNNQKLTLKKGDVISLDANVPHDLSCNINCIIRLSLSKFDTVERVKSV